MLERSRAPRGGALSLLYGLGLLLVMGVGILSVFPTTTVIIVSSNDQFLAAIPVAENEHLVYRYTHSVERTEVREYFLVKRDGLVLVKTEMQSFGAGLPTEEADGLTLKDGWYSLEIYREVPRLILRVSPLLSQMLMTQGNTIDLSSLATEKPVEIRVTRRPIIWLRLKEVLS